jgi:hypothetical protein
MKKEELLNYQHIINSSRLEREEVEVHKEQQTTATSAAT